jgi:methionyl-tRNA formyltransferase
MRVVFFGSGEFGVPSLRWLLNSAHEVALVVTQPDRPAGRGKHLAPTPIAEAAEQWGLDVIRADDVNTPEFVQKLKSIEADIGIVIAFGQKILEPARATFPSQCVNLHASLLPKYRGAAPINAAILAGESKTGVTAFRLVDRMDAGTMLVKRETQIGPMETAGELHDRLAGIGCDVLNAVFELHENNPLPEGEVQDESQATRAPKLKKSDGHLHFDEPAEMIARRVRAFTPWPGARCRYVSSEGKAVDVTLVTVTVIPGEAAVRPGVIAPQMTVAASDNLLEIHSIQPAGKRPMAWQEFVNGRHVQPGDRFESIEG